MGKDIVISTPALNAYGFRVLTGGIDVRQYLRNPVLLWNHRHDILPVGRIENLRVEGDRLIGTPVFDEADDFAKKVQSKFESGFLRMASAGLDPLETGTAKELLVEGQTRATVIKSKLVEVSMTGTGANDDALALYRDGTVCLGAPGAAGMIPAVPELPETAVKSKLNDSEMKTAALKLGLPETATEAEILNGIGALQEQARLSAGLQAEIELQRDGIVAAEVDAAIAQKKITADRREHFVALGRTAGIELLRTTLAAFEPAVRPTDLIAAGSAAGAAGAKKFADLSADERIELRKSNAGEYLRLFEAEYGYRPQLNS
jgi:hypothetical protein